VTPFDDTRSDARESTNREEAAPSGDGGQDSIPDRMSLLESSRAAVRSVATGPHRLRCDGGEPDDGELAIDGASAATGVDEASAIESLERLGLSNYEARVFVALQALGVGTAREIHDVAGVPRSQVYGAADELVSKGLLERQQSTPKRYRPVSTATARELLTARMERERERAFEFLEAVRAKQQPAETREDVWSLRGREAVTERVLELVRRADERLVFATRTMDLAPEPLLVALRERAEAGVDVTVLSDDPAVHEAVSDPVRSVRPPHERPGALTGRMLLGDDNVVLVSVKSDELETAIWSADTALADVLVQTIHAGIAPALEGDPTNGHASDPPADGDSASRRVDVDVDPDTDTDTDTDIDVDGDGVSESDDPRG
jgi:sugar-specific transcriptional regulator TrmB